MEVLFSCRGRLLKILRAPNTQQEMIGALNETDENNSSSDDEDDDEDDEPDNDVVMTDAPQIQDDDSVVVRTRSKSRRKASVAPQIQDDDSVVVRTRSKSRRKASVVMRRRSKSGRKKDDMKVAADDAVLRGKDEQEDSSDDEDSMRVIDDELVELVQNGVQCVGQGDPYLEKQYKEFGAFSLRFKDQGGKLATMVACVAAEQAVKTINGSGTQMIDFVRACLDKKCTGTI
jgi:hypothetical protein